ncbi:hypothetical protein [Antrihabitans spumae]|uniref:Uncharacterized protein n=1 Tax=Antrihabitans spumae TaxID=3373370 RepID=A0ABW7K877_9NOCA
MISRDQKDRRRAAGIAATAGEIDISAADVDRPREVVGVVGLRL